MGGKISNKIFSPKKLDAKLLLLVMYYYFRTENCDWCIGFKLEHSELWQIKCITVWFSDPRKEPTIRGRSVNLAFSVRGIAALSAVGAEGPVSQAVSMIQNYNVVLIFICKRETRFTPIHKLLLVVLSSTPTKIRCLTVLCTHFGKHSIAPLVKYFTNTSPSIFISVKK